MTPFLGQTLCVAFNFAPKGWAFCNGQVLPINQNQALFSLLGTTYGGNGQTTFALPDLRSRSAMHTGGGPGPGLPPHNLGEQAGEESVTLIQSQVPAHTHILSCNSSNGDQLSPVQHVWAKEPNGNKPFAASSTGNTLNAGAIGVVGSNQP